MAQMHPLAEQEQRQREVSRVLGGWEKGSGLNWETEADRYTWCARQTAPGNQLS